MTYRLGGTRSARRPQETSRLLTLRDAQDLFKVDEKAIYRLVELGEIEALQHDGKGRIFYAEGQLRAALKAFALASVCVAA